MAHSLLLPPSILGLVLLPHCADACRSEEQEEQSQIPKPLLFALLWALTFLPPATPGDAQGQQAPLGCAGHLWEHSRSEPGGTGLSPASCDRCFVHVGLLLAGKPLKLSSAQCCPPQGSALPLGLFKS